MSESKYDDRRTKLTPAAEAAAQSVLDRVAKRLLDDGYRAPNGRIEGGCKPDRP